MTTETDFAALARRGMPSASVTAKRFVGSIRGTPHAQLDLPLLIGKLFYGPTLARKNPVAAREILL
jgi:hypothetical protein